MKTIIPLPLLLLPISLFVGDVPKAQAASQANCYHFAFSDSPASEAHSHPRNEVWCYERLASPANSIYIYNGDELNAKPELAILSEPGGILTHGSLTAGLSTVHKVRVHDFNPFPVPLLEPQEGIARAFQPSPKLEKSAHEVLSQFLQANISLQDATAAETPMSAEAAALPWRGFGWPFKGRSLSIPLSKFDQFVTNFAGRAPGAAAWEKRNHASTGVWWEGHCNGWAASAILRAEPQEPISGLAGGITFGVSEQKGLYAEKDFCARVAFFGHRFDGRRGDDPKDIRPELFHKTLIYFLGKLHKPIAIDYHADPVVDTHVISGYRLEQRQLGANQIEVTATLNMHSYDGDRIEQPGAAPMYERVYRYTLQLDANGEPTQGKWLSENPDFLWVPLSPANCADSNPRLETQWVDALFRR